MRRTLALIALLVLAGCGGTAREPFVATRAAEPQQIELGWREAYPEEEGQQLVFVVESLEVTERGWSAEIAIENDTGATWEASGGDNRNLTYGLMLFRTGSLDELEDANRRNSLPAVREADAIEPPPPARLGAGKTWRARISADGALPDGAHVRVVFGPLVATADPPEGLERTFVWITDASHGL